MRRLPIALALSALLAIAAPGAAQGLGWSVGAGVANPLGDFGDFYGPGYTLRGQLALDLVLVDVHAQAGWSRFSADDDVSDAVDETANLTHIAVGTRFGLGLLWVGANAGYFSGDDEDGLGFFPEVGAGLGPVEAVLDVRIDGDTKWWALRGAIRF